MKITAAAGKNKYDVDVEESQTVGDVMNKLSVLSGAPTAQMRLICKGKERKPDEKLADVGVKDGAKVMLMWKPGYTPPAPPSVPAEDPSQPAEPSAPAESSEPAPVEVASEMPGENRIAIRIKQGRNMYRVTLPPATTFADLKAHMHSQTQVKADYQRYICKGKTPEDSVTMDAGGLKDGSMVMLMFKYGYHKEVEGEQWVKEIVIEVDEMEKTYEKLVTMCNGRLHDRAETNVRLMEADGMIEALASSVERVAMKPELMETMKKLEERLKTLHTNVGELRKKYS